MKRAIQAAIAVILLASLSLEWNSGFTVRVVHAQANGDLNISWTPPTEYTDGAPLLEQDLDFYSFKCDGLTLADIDSVIGTRSATVSTNGLAEGTYTCHLTVTTLAASESGPSNSINFTIGPRVPMAPAGLSLT